MNDRESTIALLRRGYDEPTRSLDFRVGFYNDLPAVKECLLTIDRYNDFDGLAVAGALDVIGDFACHVSVGRENSPVLYVRGPSELLDDLAASLLAVHADEVDVRDSELRAWWD